MADSVKDKIQEELAKITTPGSIVDLKAAIKNLDDISAILIQKYKEIENLKDSYTTGEPIVNEREVDTAVTIAKENTFVIEYLNGTGQLILDREYASLGTNIDNIYELLSNLLSAFPQVYGNTMILMCKDINSYGRDIHNIAIKFDSLEQGDYVNTDNLDYSIQVRNEPKMFDSIPDELNLLSSFFKRIHRNQGIHISNIEGWESIYPFLFNFTKTDNYPKLVLGSTINGIDYQGCTISKESFESDNVIRDITDFEIINNTNDLNKAKGLKIKIDSDNYNNLKENDKINITFNPAFNIEIISSEIITDSSDSTKAKGLRIKIDRDTYDILQQYDTVYISFNDSNGTFDSLEVTVTGKNKESEEFYLNVDFTQNKLLLDLTTGSLSKLYPKSNNSEATIISKEINNGYFLNVDFIDTDIIKNSLNKRLGNINITRISSDNNFITIDLDYTTANFTNSNNTISMEPSGSFPRGTGLTIANYIIENEQYKYPYLQLHPGLYAYIRIKYLEDNFHDVFIGVVDDIVKDGTSKIKVKLNRDITPYGRTLLKTSNIYTIRFSDENWVEKLKVISNIENNISSSTKFNGLSTYNSVFSTTESSYPEFNAKLDIANSKTTNIKPILKDNTFYKDLYVIAKIDYNLKAYSLSLPPSTRYFASNNQIIARVYSSQELTKYTPSNNNFDDINNLVYFYVDKYRFEVSLSKFEWDGVVYNIGEVFTKNAISQDLSDNNIKITQIIKGKPIWLKNWSDFNSDQETSALDLGFTEASWNDIDNIEGPADDDIRFKIWSELTPEQRTYASDLGFNEFLWNEYKLEKNSYGGGDSPLRSPNWTDHGELPFDNDSYTIVFSLPTDIFSFLKAIEGRVSTKYSLTVTNQKPITLNITNPTIEYTKYKN